MEPTKSLTGITECVKKMHRKCEKNKNTPTVERKQAGVNIQKQKMAEGPLKLKDTLKMCLLNCTD